MAPGFDASLDVKSFNETATVGDSELGVSVHSYNEGAKKIQISRKSKDQNGNMVFSKLGRVTKDEVRVLSELFQKAYATM